MRDVDKWCMYIKGGSGIFLFFFGRGGEAKFGAVSAVTGSPL